MSPPYPFSAVVGADDLKTALLLNAVHPAIGGVLVRGEKGTAKSTAVRGLAALLPDVAAVAGCRFRCDPAAPDPACPDGPHGLAVGPPGADGAHGLAVGPPGADGAQGLAVGPPGADGAQGLAVGPPGADGPHGAPGPASGDGPRDAPAVEVAPARLVELPVGASEDRLAGTLDLERALVEGRRAFEPGLLADAHRGVLYVDEVNLLGDHLVDLLLDAAAMGVNVVEREGISVRHAARFQLVGTMNPEEGELRPQLLDRFGLTVEVRASRDRAERAEVVRRRLAYEADPQRFAASWADADADVAARIRAARKLLGEVRLGERALEAVVAACAAFDVDGLRADLVTAKAATALAAWEGRGQVTVADVRAAALLALPHRCRRGPFEAPGLDPERLDEALDGLGDDDPDGAPPGGAPPRGGAGEAGPGGDAGGPPPGQANAASPAGGPSDTSAAGGPSDTSAADGPSDTSAADGSPAPGSAGAHDPRAAADGAARDDDGAGSADGAGGGSGAAQDPGSPDGGVTQGAGSAAGVGDGVRTGPGRPVTLPAGALFSPVLLATGGAGRGVAGRRSPAETDHGRHAGDRRPVGRVRDVAVGATLRAAAPQQPARGRRGPGLVLRAGDLREKVREGREANLVLFCVDASGSMAARRRMTAVKGAVLSLLADAYRRRDRVGLVTFRGDGAELVLPPTGSVDAAARLLEALPTGGRTPLAAGLARAAAVLDVERVRDPRRRPLLVLVSDGRATAAPGGTDPVDAAVAAAGALGARGVAAVVVDTEDGPVRLRLAGRVAGALGAPCLRLEQLAAGALAGVVRGLTAGRRVA